MNQTATVPKCPKCRITPLPRGKACRACDIADGLSGTGPEAKSERNRAFHQAATKMTEVQIGAMLSVTGDMGDDGYGAVTLIHGLMEERAAAKMPSEPEEKDPREELFDAKSRHYQRERVGRDWRTKMVEVSGRHDQGWRDIVWVTRDARPIAIKDMEDSHLENLARMFMRHGSYVRMQTEMFYMMGPEPGGDAARDAFDGEFANIMESEGVEYAPLFLVLILAELSNRGKGLVIDEIQQYGLDFDRAASGLGMKVCASIRLGKE